jgi:hypothetical protein
MTIALNILKFVIGFLVFIILFENILVPLVHDLPLAILQSIRRQLLPKSIWAIGWTAFSAILVLAVVLLVVAHFYPGMWDDIWINASSNYALVAVITWKFLFRKGRAETRRDFARRIERFKVSGEKVN